MYNNYHMRSHKDRPYQLVLGKRSLFRDSIVNAYESLGAATGHWLCCRTAPGFSFLQTVNKWAENKTEDTLIIDIDRETVSKIHEAWGTEDWWPGDPDEDLDSEEESK